MRVPLLCRVPAPRVVLWLALCALGGLALAGPGQARPFSDPVTMSLCGRAPRVECGRISVPLDWARPGASPRISVAFTFQPASDGHATGTLVAVEGGPGYPSIESASYYRQMYAKDLATHNLLLVDNRGTGESTPIDCPALQRLSATAGTRTVQLAAGACGRSLNQRWRYASGRWVHASDLFSSAAAGDDLAAIIAALHVGPVDIYGDSYGTYFVQVFAEQHPRLVSAVVLDSAYQVRDLDPWYRSTITTMRASFDAVCDAAPACRVEIPDAWSEISRLAARLDRRPATASVPDGNGVRHPVTVTTTGLVDLVNDAGDDTAIYRALPAAAAALVNRGDAAPLARLYAQRLVEDEDYAGPASDYSAGLYLAVACTDYPQLFSMSATPAVRTRQLAAASRRLTASTFAPFSTAQWIAQDFNTEAYSACLDWPSPGPDARSAATLAAQRLSPHIRVLILSGDLDIWTPASGDAAVAEQVGGSVQVVHFVNATHVLGDGNTACGDAVVAAFAAAPGELGAAVTRCAGRLPAIHALADFPESLSDVTALGAASRDAALAAAGGEEATAGDATTTARRLAAAAIDTAGDAIDRWTAIQYLHDRGLYGGSISANAAGTVLELRADQLIPGVEVSGSVTVQRTSGGQDAVHVSLTATAAGTPAGRFTATWTNASDAVTRVSGRVGATQLTGWMTAP